MVYNKIMRIIGMNGLQEQSIEWGLDIGNLLENDNGRL